MQAKRLVLLVVTQLLLSLVINQLISISDHSLKDSRSWTTTKATLARGVMGAQQFINDNKAVGRNHLDLSAWHGFQEVILDRETRTRAVEFDFRLERGAYVVFIFNKSAEGFSGVRLSSSQRFDSMFFTADALGGFVEKHPIEPRRVSIRKWHHANVSFGDERVVLRIDEGPTKEYSTRLRGAQRIGFRGGLKQGLVDNVVVSGDRLFREGFGRAFRSVIYLAALGAVVAVEFTLLLGLTRGRRRPGEWLPVRPVFAMATLNLALIVIGAAVGTYLFFFAQTLYPLAIAQQGNEERFKLIQADLVRQRIREAYPAHKEAGAYRILVIGSSQTWGAGAAEERHVFTERLGVLLNEDADLEARFECINAGISAVGSEELIADFYLNEWVHLEPDLVIVNLATNELRGESFERNLDRLANLNAERQIETLLVGEANASEAAFAGQTVYLEGKHEIIRGVAERNGVLYFDMHRYLLEHYDDGFLWWDFVHLTSYGHELVAHKLQQLIKNRIWAPGS